MTAHSTGRAPAAGPASAPTAAPGGPSAQAPKRRPSTPGHPSQPTLWQRRTYGFGRYAIFAIPVFALIAGLLPRSSAAFSIDPTVYAHYLATGQWRPREVLATIGLALTGVLSIAGLASLLFRGRARGFALAGLVAGLAGSAGMLASVGSTVIREDRLRHVVVDGHRHLAFNADTVGAGSAFLVIGGALLLTLGWILLGVAVIRTSGMNRADGPLLIISTPLIFLGGFVLHVLPTMGSFLLLAAGLGIVTTAGRISIIGEDTWRQRRRRLAMAVTGPAALASTSSAAPTSAVADPDAGVPLDRAPGLAGTLGLARPRLFWEGRVASAAIYHAPVASAAEASESTVAPGTDASGSTVAPASPLPDVPAPHDVPALPSPDGRPSPDAPPSTVTPVATEAPASNAATRSTSDSAAGTTDARNGSTSSGKPAGHDRAPAVKSLRDLLRGARGGAAARPASGSRPGRPDSARVAGETDRVAGEKGGQPGSSSGDGRTGTNGRTASTGPAAQPPTPPAPDKPDPPEESPPARE